MNRDAPQAPLGNQPGAATGAVAACVANDGALNGSTHHEDHRARSAGVVSSGLAAGAWCCGASGIVWPVNPQEYVDAVADRLRGDGAAVSTEVLPGGEALVGYRSQFRLRWMATKLNLFTVVRAVPEVTVSALESFSNEALDQGVKLKGRFRGLQTGVAVIPALVGEMAEPAAADYARTVLVRRWSAFAWPAVVDLHRDVVSTHEGSVTIGGIYASWMREQTAVALPLLR